MAKCSNDEKSILGFSSPLRLILLRSPPNIEQRAIEFKFDYEKQVHLKDFKLDTGLTAHSKKVRFKCLH